MSMYETPTDQMSFLVRAFSTFLHGLGSVVHELCMMLQYEKLKHFFPENQHSYAISALSEPDMVFAAYLKQFDYPRPFARNLVHVGTLQTLLSKPDSGKNGTSQKPVFPQHLTKLIAGHPRGFMIAALGHQAKWQFAPRHIKEAFFGAFSRLPKDFLVLFSYSADQPSNDEIPSNIQLVQWIPQKALLAHPQIRIFLTHVGANSLAEAVMNGVPMVALPLFADQVDGAARVESFGIGKKIHKKEISEDLLYETIMEVLENKTILETAKKFGEDLKNEPELALERAVFWTEYMARHKHREKDKDTLNLFIKSGSPLCYGWLNSLRYHCLDVICALSIASVTILFVVIKCFSRLVMTILKWRAL